MNQKVFGQDSAGVNSLVENEKLKVENYFVHTKICINNELQRLFR